MRGTLYFGDNLDVLREHIRDASVDLVYLDPPFNSAASYNVLFKAPDGKGSQSQITAFEDTWHWCEASEIAFDQVIRSGRSDVANVLRAMRQFLGENDMMAYLAMMAVRLIELHRVLKPTGSLYLHCDPTASHYLKIVLDAVFGIDRYVNEVIWRRTGSHSPRRSFGPTHDVIHFYAKTKTYTFNVVRRPYMKGHVETRYTETPDRRMKFTSGGNVLTGAGATDGPSGQQWRGFDPSAKKRHWAIPSYYDDLMPPEYRQLDSIQKLEALFTRGLVEIEPGVAWPIMVRYLDERGGTPLTDLWGYQPYTQGTVWGTPSMGIDEDVAWLGPTDPDRLGYPTQKPIGLLSRILRSSSNEGDVVLDAFCGCGTTVHAAQKLGRHWIGIDVTPLAINLIERRLREAFPGIGFDVRGIPRDLDGARELALRDKHLFQLWAVNLVDAQPYRDGRKGADGGIDGLIYFKPDGRRTKAAIVSVKGGAHVGVAQIRDLRGTIERLSEPMGIFVTLTPPTQAMEKEAAAAGLYDTGHQRVPKLQILTIEQLLGGAKPRIPFGHSLSYRRAGRESPSDDQVELGF